MFSKLKNNLFSIILVFILSCCNQEENKNEEVSECRQITIEVEDCMDIHRGALSYLEDCGSLELEKVKSFDTCEEILDYFGIGLIQD